MKAVPLLAHCPAHSGLAPCSLRAARDSGSQARSLPRTNAKRTYILVCTKRSALWSTLPSRTSRATSPGRSQGRWQTYVRCTYKAQRAVEHPALADRPRGQASRTAPRKGRRGSPRGERLGMRSATPTSMSNLAARRHFLQGFGVATLASWALPVFGEERTGTLMPTRGPVRKG